MFEESILEFLGFFRVKDLFKDLELKKVRTRFRTKLLSETINNHSSDHFRLLSTPFVRIAQ